LQKSFMSPQLDLLHTFTGISSEQMSQFIQTMLNGRVGVENKFIELLTVRPLESMVGFTVTSAVAFHLAEQDVNPKINSFVDSLYYISTCLSVGYADIFAVTDKGKLIATLVMALGPAIAANTLNPPNTAEKSMVDHLEAILQELKSQRVSLSASQSIS